MASGLVLIGVVCHFIATVGRTFEDTGMLNAHFDGRMSGDKSEIESAATDFGGMNRAQPMGVLHPESSADVVRLVRAAFKSVPGFTVSARGHGHSINGQALNSDGVVVQMRRMHRRIRVCVEKMYVDAWGGELWIDVLKKTLEVGLAPRSWTDYLYLTVGGTLSNAGISGQAFNHGPQISNVHELDVVTGKGESVTCSETQNQDLFHAVLGGLGQFGIITRARVALEPAPQRVRWIRVLYSDFTVFSSDQEYLISLHDGTPGDGGKFDYVEGFVITDESLVNNWRSSFFSPGNPLNVSTFAAGNSGVLYCLEVTKNHDDSSSVTVDGDVDALLRQLNFIPGSVFTSDLSYVAFLDRVHSSELKLRSKGTWEVPHPWLNLFVPKSRISDFDRGVFKGIMGKKTGGPVLIYPMYKNKWDNRTSAVTPDEDVFYLVAFLRSALGISTLETLENENRRILRFCHVESIDVKRYLPHYSTQEEWRIHFGDKWTQFSKRKMTYDPKRILATGQRIFRSRSILEMDHS